MNTCPYCQANEQQVKNGLNTSGTQRCGRVYTPEPKEQGYSDGVRLRAVSLYVDGMNIRRIAGTLGVNHQSVANWVKQHVQCLPLAPVPTQPEVIELDEWFTFWRKKGVT